MKNPKHTLGIDIGGTKILCAVAGKGGKVLGRGKQKTGPGDPERLLGRLQIAVDKALEDSAVNREDIDCIGLGFPGPLDPWKGIVHEAVNLPGWEDYPLTERISEMYDRPTFLDNDVNVGTLAEALVGAGKGAQNVIGIFLGTGVGGGIVLGGKIYHGTPGTAGEIGHVIIKHNGPPGPRGLRGSVEALASRNGIVADIKRQIKKGKKCILKDALTDESKIGSKALAKAYNQKDPVVVKSIDMASEYVGVLIGSLVNLLAPDVIVLGGGMIEALPEAILSQAKKVGKQIAFEKPWKSVFIERAALGDDAGAVGAGLMARQRYEQE